MSVYIENLGLVNALGGDKNQVLKQLLKNESLGHKKVEPLISGQAAMTCAVVTPLPEIDEKLKKYQCRNNQMILAAYLQIKENVDAAIKAFGAARVAIILGTTTSGTADVDEQRDKKSYHYVQEELNGGAEFLAKISGVQGVAYTISTACTSSGKAMIAAKRYLDNDLFDAVITGGSDTLGPRTINGFDALDSVDADITVPFSKNRKGINLGEGACLMLLNKHRGDSNNQTPRIVLKGTGESSDAYHISSPDPQAVGAIMAMQQALEEAELTRNDIAYINLHGTGTPLNDIMEAKAVNTVLGNQVPCSSTKPLIGHTLGAAAVHELALCWLLLSEKNSDRMILKHKFDNQKDPELDDINILMENETFTKNNMMSNSFAFGGSNVSILIGVEE